MIQRTPLDPSRRVPCPTQQPSWGRSRQGLDNEALRLLVDPGNQVGDRGLALDGEPPGTSSLSAALDDASGQHGELLSQLVVSPCCGAPPPSWARLRCARHQVMKNRACRHAAQDCQRRPTAAGSVTRSGGCAAAAGVSLTPAWLQPGFSAWRQPAGGSLRSRTSSTNRFTNSPSGCGPSSSPRSRTLTAPRSARDRRRTSR